ncbi:mycothiol transferase [Aquipuribacter sp. SD81]|uniref:mycothiol transferase n=1 Tax=Aquipuribacter sp. SD81 TaxID=3127703 RepID=UPI003017EF69
MTDPGGAPPWEPPMAGDEVSHLLGALDRQRATFRWKADGLDEDGLAVRVGRSELTLGGLLLHLASVEEEISTWRLAGQRPGEPFDVEAGHDTSFATAAARSPEDLYGAYDAAVARSRGRFEAAVADGGLDQRVHLGRPDVHVNLRRLLFDLLEEYGRHTGHADLLREAVDGRVGEDPPEDWRPPA